MLCLLCKDTAEKMAICQPASMSSPRTELASSLVLDCPASRAEEKKNLLFQPLSLSYFVMVAQAE